VTKRRTTLVRMIGVILALLGLLWTLQGSGVLGGSVMSGERTWLVAGVIFLIVGIALLLWTVAVRRRGGTGTTDGGTDRTGVL
jgi:phosphatidylglycerophosphate synthase